ncbi:sonic hedgehog protein A-like [Anneissia japonica]|uniref:sonic hedgehog protein A-like n=1 Tax=Anneissia japonica TaxID=1529436 RepID=UPI001425A8E5|nr:sonic hedgehog protein A-like [Anneissia japonica]
MKKLRKIYHLVVVACVTFGGIAFACSPSRSGGSSRRQDAMRPLNYREYVPSMSEVQVPASGEPEGRIYRGDAAFNELTTNMNSDIEFKDEEETGADQVMTQRCNDRLSRLAIMVMKHWKDENIKLRVVEAWDEDSRHPENSLHYEGRAVDITTSDTDQSKYGMLARLAVEAGFDWVYYESRSYIHASVKSDSNPASKEGGCFPAESEVTLETGETKRMIDLRVGDSVKAVDGDGGIIYSDVIMMMDAKPDHNATFLTLHTPSHAITLTAEHIIYVSHRQSNFLESRATFASRVLEGQYIFTVVKNGDKEHLIPEKVVKVSVNERTGVFAPLTYKGSIVVDDVAASSYAIIDSEYIAHASFTPVRWLYSLKKQLWGRSSYSEHDSNIHWYPRFLYNYGHHFVSSHLYPGIRLV